jgi:hypothetical protein
MAESGRWSITPRRVLIAFITIITIGLIVSPSTMPGSGGVLTSFASDPGGARGFFETTRRLGWPTTRLLDRFEGPLDSAAIYVVLRPMVPPTSREVAAVLDAVRRGAGLLIVPGFRSVFSDSLGLVTLPLPPFGVELVDSTAWDTLGVVEPSPRWPLSVLRIKDDAPDTSIIMLAVREEDSEADSILPVVVGMPLGRGRVAVMSHGGVFANAVFRDDSNAILPVRLLEWVAPGQRPPVVFAEYHQGHGRHASVMKTIRGELANTPGGRAVLQLLLAAGLLLLAAGVRPIAPRARVRSERRSPLEHVGALAHAYAEVHATRTALRRLIRGLRRRHPIGTLRSASDAEYLAFVAARHPTVARDVDALLTLIQTPPAPDRFEAAGAAIANIERTLGT